MVMPAKAPGKPGIMLILLLLGAVLITLLAGCSGESENLPFGSVVSISTIGGEQVISGATTTVVIQKYRVSVLGTDGFPMNGISVNVMANFNTGNDITVNGIPVAIGQTLNFTETTQDAGFFEFDISAPQLTTANLAVPSSVLATALSSGGTLTAGSWDYCVTAVDPMGNETTGSSIATAVTGTTGTSSVTITWSAVSGASGYFVYGRTSGNPCTSQFRLSPQLTASTFTDMGGSVGSQNPPATNQTKAGNSVKGTLTATSGASVATKDVAL